MNEVTFSHVCRAFHNHMIKPEMTSISRALLDLFIKDESVLNERNEPYCINGKEYIEFFKGEENIYPNIKRAAEKAVARTIEFAITQVFDDLIVELEHDKVAEELCELIKNDTSIEGWKRDQILNATDTYEIAALTLLYAMGNDNLAVRKPPRKRTPNVKTTLEAFKEIIATLPKPVMISIPDKLSVTEMTYVSAILEAFAEDAGVMVMTRDDLISKSEYAKYKTKFDRYRRDYYAAESIHESLKDTHISAEEDLFAQLKDETYDAVIDKVEEEYETSYKRMTETLKYITTVSLSNLIAQIPGWVQASQKKGLCHMLVNEERMRWKDE